LWTGHARLALRTLRPRQQCAGAELSTRSHHDRHSAGTQIIAIDTCDKRACLIGIANADRVALNGNARASDRNVVAAIGEEATRGLPNGNVEAAVRTA
jgi:hypothetical protein